MDKLTPFHPDTLAGAIQSLAANSTLDVTGATGKPDPQRKGVWLIRLPDGTAWLVYLAGYDQLSQAPFDDFEQVWT